MVSFTLLSSTDSVLKGSKMSCQVRCSSSGRRRGTSNPCRRQVPRMAHHILQVCLLAVLATDPRAVDAFSLSMSTPRPSSSDKMKNQLRQNPPFSAPISVTGGLISQLAIVALRLRLADQSDVSCEVSSSSSDLLLRGRVGPVTVKGRGWKSGLGLTCRAIEATVDTCELNVGRILSNRKLSLTVPAKGNAMIALDNLDFGNFITHPLIRPPVVALSDATDGSQIKFLQQGTQIDPVHGTITFRVTLMGLEWKCVLQRGSTEQKRALIEATPVDPTGMDDLEATARVLTDALTVYFNELVFELDGTSLSFRDLMITDKGESPSVMFALNIVVTKFPSPGLAF
jgi:hypothetical protein